MKRRLVQQMYMRPISMGGLDALNGIFKRLIHSVRFFAKKLPESIKRHHGGSKANNAANGAGEIKMNNNNFGRQ